MPPVRRLLRFFTYSVLLLLALWAFWLEPDSLRVHRQMLELTRWPQACDGLKIAVLADLHIGSPWNHVEKLQKIIQRTNALKPDIILLAGDYVIHGVLGGEHVSIETIAAHLKKLQAPMGVYAVLGNHDWWENAERIGSVISANSISLLENKSQTIIQGECRFRLTGLSDFLEGPRNISIINEDNDRQDALIVFTHNPDIFPLLPSGRIALSIAGHTHGGQVNLPFFGPPIVPSIYGQRYAAGHLDEGGEQRYISSGSGTSILPVRFRVPPEITLLQLQSGSSAQE
ncbi:MAG: metallophosphoesterase [gamma proteobacterium symbiont of Bathyaustriella thionipta]|nr:metallophosphoesterase [gamma proteobacterium symbiont of Bathyaustriella thionipta]